MGRRVVSAGVTRHLVAAERALERVQASMRLAQGQPGGPDLSEGWRGLEQLSLVLQAERFDAEDRDEAGS